MKTEVDLGQWLAKLDVGRAACVFSPDVSDTLSVLGQAAASTRQPLRVVSMTWQAVPPLANELGLLVSALARATLDFFPALYGFEQDSEPSRWSKSVVEQEAHAITRGVPDVDGVACRRILGACHRGDVPSLGKLQRAEQARQFALTIEPKRLLVMVAWSWTRRRAMRHCVRWRKGLNGLRAIPRAGSLWSCRDNSRATSSSIM